MKKNCHILNGDALKEQFPKQLPGEIIVARECLVDGPVKAKSLKELFSTRAKFIADNYEGYTQADYFKDTVPEFKRIQEIPEKAHINLWFEDDLFCQVNLWFVLHLLQETAGTYALFLIRPAPKTPYSFGSMNTTDLLSAFHNRSEITSTELHRLSRLWKYYQEEDQESMLRIAKHLSQRYPFLLPAVEAQIDRVPVNGSYGRPEQSLLQIMNDLETAELGPVFQEFCKRERIYGFGDLQVKRLIDENLL